MDPHLPPLSPVDLLTSLRAASDDDALRTRIEVKRWLSIIEVLLPAALLAAAAGNITMRDAIFRICPLLPKSPNPGS